jgi:WD40 repeat protein
VTGLIFAPNGDNLYSSSSNGSLALYDTHCGGGGNDDSVECRVVRVMGNTVAKGERYGPRALTLSEDGSRLAVIGPMEFTVTVLDAHTMEEVIGRGGIIKCFFIWYLLIVAIN